MIVLQVILGVIVFSLPLWTGFVFRRKTIAESWLYGQVFLWAAFQAMAVPMIHLRFSFTALWITYAVFLAGTAVAAVPPVRVFLPADEGLRFTEMYCGVEVC